MKPVSIIAASDVYACSENISIKLHSVEYPELQVFSNDFNRFINLLGETIEEDYWAFYVRRLRRFRFDICAAPLSAQYLENYSTDLYLSLKKHLQPCSLVYPSLARPAFSILEHLASLSKANTTSLLDAIVKLGESEREKKAALLIKESRLIPLVEDAIRPFPILERWEVVSPSDLRDDNCYQMLVVTGPPRWFPDYIFAAPRASETFIVAYSWINSKWVPEPVFIHPIEPKTSADTIVGSGDGDYLVNPEVLLPTIDLNRIIAKAGREIDISNEDDYIEAQILILEGEWAVFLEADKSASVLLIDLDEEIKKRIKRTTMQKVEPGTYILLRTGGGGDYVVPVADRIMGSYAPVARERQMLWKSRLRDLERKHGIDFVVAELKRHGSPRANEINARNWMSARGIKTHDFKDFRAIMHLVGLGDEAGQYWHTMEIIDSAHRKAGFHIRSLLLERVNDSDLRELRRLGIMNFQLPEKDAGTLTAFRVQAVLPDVIQVVPGRIGNPFKLEEM